MNATLDAALGYAAEDWPIFPCRPWPSKAPLVGGGFHAATTDPVIIERWWRRWPNAIIGSPTGIRSVALDVDPRHGGIETLAALGFAALPETLTAKTAGGGFHLHFAPPDPPIRNTTGADGRRGVGAGLDWRGLGGYVILPSPGSGYSWVAETRGLPPAPVPAALMPRPSHLADGVGEPAETDELTPYGEAALRSACDNILDAPDGRQQATINAESYAIGRPAGCGDVPRRLALDVLVRAARGIPTYDRRRPWRPGQAEAMVRRAFREGLAKPRLSLEEKRRDLDEAIEEMVRTGVEVDWMIPRDGG
jgi:hypothetical protein